jgi:predicted nucleotidyltransferase
MSETGGGPKPYPGVTAVLQELLARVKAILGEQFIGMYLYGSLAAGDFDPDSSDIDFLVATQGELSDPMIAGLERMHLKLASSDSKWAKKLEGAYVPLHALRLYNRDDPARPTINEGHFYLDRQGSDWVIQRHVLREHGATVQGPLLRVYIDPVQPDDLRSAVVDVLRGWWTLMLQEPARLQAPGYQPFAVLSMCRALYTFEHGTIPSKSEAARWAMATLDSEWSALIERAVTGRHDNIIGSINHTLDFIRYTIEQSQKIGVQVDRPCAMLRRDSKAAGPPAL